MIYAEKHKVLVEYLLAKVHERDWHGVSDAANDLRVLEAQQHTKAELAEELHEAQYSPKPRRPK